jgi:aspartyl-tRNA(Asn)/glutamyl-tRNA(Gln) amidotransferase subunit A
MNLLNDEKLTISRIAPLIRRKQISPVELTEFFLERIHRLQPKLNAFITITAGLARKQARQAEREILRGEYRGPLHGIPISLKDLFYTAGIRTTAGSKILRSFVPGENAVVVDRLLEAGAVLLGKTNLHEFAYGVTSNNPHYGPVHNPWDLKRVSGGSSGGSAAAVSAALGIASLGTDTGGSIRIPSAACGVVGLKPTRGLVSLSGVIPLAFSLDHVGPICRCVEDVALMLEVIASPTGRSSTNWPQVGRLFSRPLRRGVRGIRVGIPKQYFFDRLEKNVRGYVLTACAMLYQQGAELREVQFRGMKDAAPLVGVITVGEALSFHREWLQSRAGDYGADVRERMEANRAQRTVDYLQAQEKRRIYTGVFLKVFESVDVVAAPTLPVLAPLIGQKEIDWGRTQEDVRAALLRMTRPGNLTGLPAISLPCGSTADNLPVGLQLLSRHYDEATLLRVAYAFERATPWHKMFPPL